MKYLLLISALSLSGIAAYFSIIGLSTIFPGSVTSIVVMAVALEVAKIVAAVWTHQNWKKTSILTKIYLSFAIFILMGITSAGIFGFLSKSHIEHSSSVSFSENLISEIERKISLEEDSITRQKAFISDKKLIKNFSEDKNQKIIDQLSSNIDLLYSRLDSDINQINSKISQHQERLSFMDDQLQDLRNQKTGFFSSNSKKIKDLEESQKEERDYISNQLKFLNESIITIRGESTSKAEEINLEIRKLQNTKVELNQNDLELISSHEDKIKESLSKIEELNLKKFELNSKNLKIENELGPVKYIAELIKDFGGPDLNTGGSIRLVIIFIVCVFDPLAIVLVICASNSFITGKKKHLNNSSGPASETPIKTNIPPTDAERIPAEIPQVSGAPEQPAVGDHKEEQSSTDLGKTDLANPSPAPKNNIIHKDGYKYLGDSK